MPRYNLSKHFWSKNTFKGAARSSKKSKTEPVKLTLETNNENEQPGTHTTYSPPDLASASSKKIKSGQKKKKKAWKEKL